MPKLKTKSGAKKRFARTATGKIKRNWGHKRHRLISKSKQQKRLHRGTTTMEKGDAKLGLTYMPYLGGGAMARVKRGVTAHARHKKVLELAKGYRGRNSTVYRIAIEKGQQALRYAHRARRN